VNWESLTSTWRRAAEEEYKHYGLFTLRGLESRHGGGKKDIAALFTYAVLDHFAKADGVLALVVHVSLFKTSGAGEGYRRFQLGLNEQFCVEEAHDFRSFQPFRTHPHMKIKTRTLTFRAVKGKRTDYPVRYVVWRKLTPGFIPGGLTWEEAHPRLASTQMEATPLRGTSIAGRLTPWLTVPSGELRRLKKTIAKPNYLPHYQGREGINTLGLNGAFFLEILETNPDGTVLIRNLHDVGKIKCQAIKAVLEGDLVYPLLRGRSMGRWKYKSAEHVLIVQDPKTQRGYPEKWLEETHPLTWRYLKKFEPLLRERKVFRKFFNPDEDPFYSMYGVTEDTFASFKVAWMDISATFKAAVISGLPGNEMVIPEHTVMFLTTGSEEEAHYVAAVLNSEPVDTVVAGYIVDNHLSTHPIENVVIPKFDKHDQLHLCLASLSRDAHVAAARDDVTGAKKAEKEIERAIGKLW
jgi:hypothetical protein